MAELKIWEDDPSLYLFTSLTAGSSHIITATSRIETILKANRIPFSYIDTASNESAKKLFQRRARGKKLPLLVKEGFVIADIEQLEDWNEFGEVKEAIGPVATTSSSVTTTPAKDPSTPTPITTKGGPSKAAAVLASAGLSSSGGIAKEENTAPPSPRSLAMKQAAEETSAKAKEKKTPAPLNPVTNAMSSSSTSTEPATGRESEKSPLSPSSVPLPATPADGLASALSGTGGGTNSPKRVSSPLHSPSRPSPHGRHSSGGSTHSTHFVPGHFEPPKMAHRGSNLSLETTDDEIKKLESEQTIHEADEEEDVEDVKTKVKAEECKAGASGSKKETEDNEEAENSSQSGQLPTMGQLHIRGGPQKILGVMESAGQAREDDLAPSSEPEPKAPHSETKTGLEEGVEEGVEKIRIQDQGAAEGKDAGASVED